MEEHPLRLRLRRRVSSNRLAWIGAVGILLVVLAATLAPFVAPYDPMAMQTSRRFLPAGAPGHLLGTDEFGRDVLSRIIWGGRISLLVAGVSVAIATLLSGLLGVIAGFVAGAFDTVASLAWGVLDEASLGFLGLGVQPPTPSWGAMLTTGRQFFYQSPTIPLFAGLAVLLAVFAFNLFGDGLRDLLDPRAWSRAD